MNTSIMNGIKESLIFGGVLLVIMLINIFIRWNLIEYNKEVIILLSSFFVAIMIIGFISGYTKIDSTKEA